ncbi:hypothetical protein AQUCO_01400540v1 [Aquilegia coerulea]|uniref:FAF domain-containing protein n=1 Tax=Aquilegia coerulea TaxID=218851 RepID=A0A2G5DWW4_AQUCA|nr:hypothetical protein AQUCO_01400540v1 [Aquilegia coerulea]
MSSSPLISPSSSSLVKKSFEKRKKKKEFPPPIPLLARTGNLPCHMPWVLKRCYTNGRLVLREVPVKHHEYFKADRSNGRLVLRIMYMADDQLASKENVPQHVLDAGDDVVLNEDATPSTSSMNVEEDLKQNHVEPDYSDCDCGGDAGGSDGDVDMESTCHRENGLDVKQDEEVEASSPVVEDKQQVQQQQQQQQHKVLNNVLNESKTLSSSMPEARLWCLPKDTKNDFFRMGTPTIRPIYI